MTHEFRLVQQVWSEEEGCYLPEDADVVVTCLTYVEEPGMLEEIEAERKEQRGERLLEGS